MRALAASRGRELPPADVKILAEEAGRGCLTGCLLGAVLYPLKRLFRKIFYFLEWKRAADTATHTLYFGMLFDHTLEKRWITPDGPFEAAQVRAGIDGILRDEGTALVERAFRETFKRSARTLREAAAFLQRGLPRLRRRRLTQDEVGRALDSLETERQVEAMAGDLEQEMEKIPPQHWDRLRALLAVRLGVD